VRFYTVPDAKTARVSVVWAMIIIGLFYIMTTFLGFGAATILTPANHLGRKHERTAARGETRRRSFLRVHQRGGLRDDPCGGRRLTISASTSFAHDFFTNVIHHGKEHRPGEEVRVARITAFVVGAVAIFLAIKLQTINVAFLVGLAFAVAASANLPVIVLSIFWRRFNTAGAVAGLGVGLLASIILIAISPSVMGTDAKALIHGAPLFPLKNPASSASRSASSARSSARSSPANLPRKRSSRNSPCGRTRDSEPRRHGALNLSAPMKWRLIKIGFLICAITVEFVVATLLFLPSVARSAPR
jgi:cation/acetate symporter